MASHQPPIVANVVSLPVDLIEVGERLRPVDPVWADALGKIRMADGERQPIEVCSLPGRDGYLLVTGAHRLTGNRLQGQTHINAVVVSADSLERRDREISENLWHKGLDPLDRASFVAELIVVRKLKAGVDPAKDGRSLSAAVRWADQVKTDAADASDSVSVAYGFSSEVAAHVGVSQRTIERDLYLYRGLAGGIASRIRRLPISTKASQLKALAGLASDRQREVVGLLEQGTAKTVAEAVGILAQTPPADPAKKRLAAFVGAYSRMSHAERRAALSQLKDMLPRGVTLSLGGDHE